MSCPPFTSIAAAGCSSGKRTARRWPSCGAPSTCRPTKPQAHLLVGRIHLRAGRPADAVEALKISIWSADSAAARVALAEAYLKQQNTAAARTELDRALVLDPESAEAKRLLATLVGK